MRQIVSPGRLRPLVDRKTPHQLYRRDKRIIQRNTTLAREHAKTRGALTSFYNRTFLQRLRWLLLGR